MSDLNVRWRGVSLGAVRAKQSESESEMMTGDTIDASNLRRAKTIAKNTAWNIVIKSTGRTENDQLREGIIYLYWTFHRSEKTSV